MTLPEKKPYENAGIHRVVISTSNRISGNIYDCYVPVAASSTLDAKNLHYVRLESTSVVTSTNPEGFYVDIDTFIQPYSYNSTTGQENSWIGVVNVKTTQGSNYVLQSVAGDNQPVYCDSIETVMKSGSFHVRLLNADGTPNTNITTDVTIVLIIS